MTIITNRTRLWKIANLKNGHKMELNASYVNLVLDWIFNREHVSLMFGIVKIIWDKISLNVQSVFQVMHCPIISVTELLAIVNISIILPTNVSVVSQVSLYKTTNAFQYLVFQDNIKTLKENALMET